MTALKTVGSPSLSCQGGQIMCRVQQFPKAGRECWVNQFFFHESRGFFKYYYRKRRDGLSSPYPSGWLGRQVDQTYIVCLPQDGREEFIN